MTGPSFTRFESATGMVYGRRGSGPAVLLLHGWCLNRRLWTYHEELLSARADVLTPDLAGFGASDGLAGPYSLDRYSRDVESLVEETGCSDVTVVGFAFGAAVAMATAARGVAPLRRLVLIGAPSAAHAAYDRMPRAMRRDWPLFAERSARAICAQPQSEATLAWLTAMFAATPLPVALETCGLLGKFEPTALAASVGVPSVLVHGEQDEIVPVEVSRACAAAMPCGVVEIVPDSGHLVVLDQKERLGQLLKAAVGGS